MEADLSAALETDGFAGIGIMGRTWYYAAFGNGAVRLFHGTAEGAEQELAGLPYQKTELTLRMCIREGFVSFLFGSGLSAFQPLGDAYPLAAGGWTGARPGIFCLSRKSGPAGYADFHSVRMTECPE